MQSTVECSVGCFVECSVNKRCQTSASSQSTYLSDLAGCRFSEVGAECSVVRINPDFPMPDCTEAGDVKFVPVMARGLEALQKIDVTMQKLKGLN